jgi:uncharacterized protein (DUF2237 family)
MTRQKNMSIGYCLSGGCIFAAFVAAAYLTVLCVGPTLYFIRSGVCARVPHDCFCAVLCPFLNECFVQQTLSNNDFVVGGASVRSTVSPLRSQKLNKYYAFP